MRKRATISVPADAQSSQVEAVLTLGEQSAAALRAQGFDVTAGEPIDLGVLAVAHRNPIKNAWFRFRHRNDRKRAGEILFAHQAYVAAEMAAGR